MKDKIFGAPAVLMRYEHFLSPFTSSPKAKNLLAIFVILVFAGVNITSVLRGYSLTTDEDKHILYGERVASGDSTRIDDSKMPVTALNALPKKLASVLLQEK